MDTFVVRLDRMFTLGTIELHKKYDLPDYGMVIVNSIESVEITHEIVTVKLKGVKL